MFPHFYSLSNKADFTKKYSTSVSEAQLRDLKAETSISKYETSYSLSASFVYNGSNYRKEHDDHDHA